MKSSHLFRLVICMGMLIATLAHPKPVSACSCVESGTPAEEFIQVDAIFRGRVVRIVDNYTPYFSIIDRALYKLGSKQLLYFYFFSKNERLYGFDIFFKVIDSWKGVEYSYVRVSTNRGGGDCGYSFEMNRDYLVYLYYAYGAPGNYWVTSICSRTTDVNYAVEDFDYLNSVPKLSIKSSPPILWAAKDTLTLMTILATVSLFAIVWRRYKKRMNTQFSV